MHGLNTTEREADKEKSQPHRTHMKRITGKRRFHHYPRRGYVIHASQGIGHTAAFFYFELSGGTAEQREKAEEWRIMFLQIKELLTP